MFGPKVETRSCLLHLGPSIQTVGHPLAFTDSHFRKLFHRHPLTGWNIERVHIGLIESYCWLNMGISILDASLPHCNQHILHLDSVNSNLSTPHTLLL